MPRRGGGQQTTTPAEKFRAIAQNIEPSGEWKLDLTDANWRNLSNIMNLFGKTKDAESDKLFDKIIAPKEHQKRDLQMQLQALRQQGGNESQIQSLSEQLQDLQTELDKEDADHELLSDMAKIWHEKREIVHLLTRMYEISLPPPNYTKIDLSRPATAEIIKNMTLSNLTPEEIAKHDNMVRYFLTQNKDMLDREEFDELLSSLEERNADLFGELIAIMPPAEPEEE